LVATKEELLRRLEWSGRLPKSGDRIISELIAKGELIQSPELVDYARVVYLPETAAAKAGSAMKTLWRWATRYMNTNPSTAGVMCAKRNLERRAADVEVQISVGSYTDSLKLLEELAEEECNGDVREAIALAAYQASRRKWQTAEIAPGKYAVKSSSENLTSNDFEVLRMKTTLRALRVREQQLEEVLQSHIASAKDTFGNMNLPEKTRKSRASAFMQRSKMTEKKMDHLSVLSRKIETALSSVDEAHSTNDAVETLEQSMKVLQDVQIDVDRLDDLLLDMEGHMETNAQINAAFSQRRQTDLDDDDAIEKQLESLAAELENTRISGVGHSERPNMRLPNDALTTSAAVEKNIPGLATNRETRAVEGGLSEHPAGSAVAFGLFGAAEVTSYSTVLSTEDTSHVQDANRSRASVGSNLETAKQSVGVTASTVQVENLQAPQKAEEKEPASA